MLVPEGTNQGKREERSHETFEHKQDLFKQQRHAAAKLRGKQIRLNAQEMSRTKAAEAKTAGATARLQRQEDARARAIQERKEQRKVFVLAAAAEEER